MLNAVAERARVVSADVVQGEKLRVVPILGPSAQEPGYELFRKETSSKVKVSEISEAGSVPTLHVENGLDVRVFLLDGQELVGAKQNRILNTDVMVPAKSQLNIPVSCIEQGRWRHNSAGFVHGGHSSSHSLRKSKSASVHASLKSGAGHSGNQGEVWAEVAACLDRSVASSSTHSLSDAYAHRQAELTAFQQSLRLPEQAVGVAVFHGGQFQGLDLFDRHSTLQYFWDALLDSYSIDLLAEAIEPAATANASSQENSPEDQAIPHHLDRAAGGKWEKFPSPGEGDDWRLEDEQLTGAALVWGEKSLIHLQLFPRPTETVDPSMPNFRSRIRWR